MKFAILCVDDEEIILNALDALLNEHFGEYCLIELAQSGEDGLEIIREFMTEGVEMVVVISDWLMPGMKGDEFLIEVKKLCPGMEQIMLSGHADESAVENARKHKALDEFVHKPWDASKLLKLISNGLCKHGCMVPEKSY